jgi:phosphoglucomutase
VASGPENDFGIKYNLSNGAPAPEAATNKIFEVAKNLHSYKIADLPEVDLTAIGTKQYGSLEVEIIDPVADYVEMLKEIFDFALIKRFLDKHSDFKILFDGLHGVTGPYAVRLFQQELGLPASSTQNCEPLPDFGGGHPDPNLTYAHSLVAAVDAGGVHFGAASDGDGDRNMIYGARAFVSPGDSLAIIAHHAKRIPYFRTHGVHGLARSMPTSSAVDRVAQRQALACYEVPTGWKFFCALFDSGRLSICGEESFGTGSDHIREKDGLWAVLAWLNIIAGVAEEAEQMAPGGASAQGDVATPSIASIQRDFWQTYGRTYFTRYDYENVDAAGAQRLVEHLAERAAGAQRDAFVGSRVGSVGGGGTELTVVDAGDFAYTDLDGSVSKHQGLYVRLSDSSRLVVRLSGTGSGATVRLYVEKHEGDAARLELDAQEYLADNIRVAVELLKFEEFIGRREPDVKT